MAKTNKKAEEQPKQATQEEQTQQPEQHTQEEQTKSPEYMIKCCNPINESFGGVSFSNGIAYTGNCFTASWFRNKEGYTVSEV